MASVASLGATVWAATPLALRAALCVLAIQVVLIGGLVLHAIARRLRLNRAALEDAARAKHVESVILDVLMARMDDPNAIITLPKLEERDRERFRTLLLSNILALRGTEHRLLSALYVHLGLLADDTVALKSSRWWVRLAALSAVESLGRTEDVDVLMRIAEDDVHPIVSLSALRAVSALATDEAILARVVYVAAARGGLRNDVLTEILINTGRKNMGLVRRLVADHGAPPDALLAALHACAVVRDPELVDVLAWRTHHPRAKVVLAALEALAQCGDPELQDRLTLFATHDDESVRSGAASLGRRFA